MSEGNHEAGIGDRVRAARERAGMSREALAFHSGISWSAIAQVETGRRMNLRPSTLAALAGTLGVTIDYLVCGRAPEQSMLKHRALFYADESHFLNAAEAFLTPGAGRSEPALVVTSQDKIDALQDRLGSGAEAIQFADHIEWCQAPSDPLERYHEFLRTAVAGGAAWVRILGEPVWQGRGDAVGRQCSRYESLLNLVFASQPLSLLCSYNTAKHDKQVIEAAQALHDGVESAAVQPSP